MRDIAIKILVATALAFAWVVLGAIARCEITIEGTTRVERDKPLALELKGVEPKSAVRWSYDKKNLTSIKGADGKTYFVGRPGKYLIEVLAIRVTPDGQAVLDEAEANVEITDGTLPPLPGPTPGPAPGPQPVPAGKAWVVVVEETAKASEGRGSYFASNKLSDYMKKKGWLWRITDVNARTRDQKTPADVQPYIDRAVKSGKALPWLMVVDGKGKLCMEGTLTGTPEELLSRLKEVGGE